MDSPPPPPQINVRWMRSGNDHALSPPPPGAERSSGRATPRFGSLGDTEPLRSTHARPHDSTHSFLSPTDRSSSFSDGNPMAWRSRVREKFLLALACIVPVILGSLLLAAMIHNYRVTGPFFEFVQNDRATTQIVVSIFAALIASINIYTLTTLLNLATRIYLLRRGLSLSGIKFLGAIVTRRLGNGLPLALFVATFIVVIVFTIPNILWTGALTPVVTNLSSTLLNTLRIPQYSDASKSHWSSNSLRALGCTRIVNSKGIFSDCATTTFQSSLLSRASQASVNRTGLHVKNDNSGYSFVGRSYGVGSVAGLSDEDIQSHVIGTTLEAYNYSEPGYRTEVKCFKNDSLTYSIADIHIDVDPTFADSGTPLLFSVEGWFPWESIRVDRSNIEHFATVAFDKSDLAAVSAKYDENAGPSGQKTIISVAGSNYPLLNLLQCDVTFHPTTFDVNVDVVAKLIRVNPRLDGEASSFDPTTGLAYTCINQLNSLSMIGTSLYTSIVGDALMQNINSSTKPEDALSVKFERIGDSFAVMFDGLLGFVASSQFYLPNDGKGDTQVQPVDLTVQAVKIGDPQYIVAVFLICLALLVISLVEAVRTVGWRRLPRWDMTDSTCLVLAGAVAGNDLVQNIEHHHDNVNSLTEWNGDGRETLHGARLRIGRKNFDPMKESHSQSAISFQTRYSTNVELLR